MNLKTKGVMLFVFPFCVMVNDPEDDRRKQAEDAQQRAKESLKTSWLKICASEDLIRLSAQLLKSIRSFLQKKNN